MTNRKMKILIIQPGVSTYRIDFFNAVAKKAELKVLYFFDDEKWQQEMVNANVKSDLHNCEVEKISGGFDFHGYPIRPGLWRAIKGFSPDIVVAHEYNPVTLQVFLIQKIFRAKWKFFVWSCDTSWMAESCGSFRRIARNFFCNHANGIMVYSNDTLETYKKLTRVAANKIMVCPNVQSTERLRRDAMTAETLSAKILEGYDFKGKKIFLFVGRLRPIKNLPALIDAFVEAKMPNAMLIFVGDGEMEKELKRKTADLNATDKIVFVGSHTGVELMSYYNISDVLILPSFNETFGAVVNEALAIGLRVILSKKAGAKILIDNAGTQGTLIDPNCKQEIINAITTEYGKIGDRHSLRRDSLMIWDLPEFTNSFLDFCRNAIKGGK